MCPLAMTRWPGHENIITHRQYDCKDTTKLHLNSLQSVIECEPRVQTRYVRYPTWAVHDRRSGFLVLSLRYRYSERCGVNGEAGSEFRNEVRTRASSRGGYAHFAPRANQILYNQIGLLRLVDRPQSSTLCLYRQSP